MFIWSQLHMVQKIIWNDQQSNYQNQFYIHTNDIIHNFITQLIHSSTVLQPVITDITITPAPNNDSQLLHQFNETVSLTCTAEGGPRIMTRWQFDDRSSVVTVASLVI